MPTQFANTLNNHPIYADRAEKDAAGNTITTTYQEKLTAGNMLSVTNSTLNVTTTAGVTDIQVVNALPANPVATVMYCIPVT